MTQHFVFLNDSELRWVDVLENHTNAAEVLANSLVSEGAPTPEGCIVTNTTTVTNVSSIDSSLRHWATVCDYATQAP